MHADVIAAMMPTLRRIFSRAAPLMKAERAFLGLVDWLEEACVEREARLGPPWIANQVDGLQHLHCASPRASAALALRTWGRGT